MYVYGACLFYDGCSDCVGICGNVCCVAAVVKDNFSLGVLKYDICLYNGCDGCCVFCLYCDAWSCRCSCMGSMSVSSCRWCMFVYWVHPLAGFNAAFCMTCSLLMLVEDARDNNTIWKGMLQSGSHDCFIGSHECLLLFTPSCCCGSFNNL